MHHLLLLLFLLLLVCRSAITGIPKVSSDISFLVFPTPAPGTIPVSDNCIVLLILSILLEAKASITITSFGFVLSTTPFIISNVFYTCCS